MKKILGMLLYGGVMSWHVYDEEISSARDS